MVASRLHPDEPHIDERLVRGLLAGQFPEWADLPLRRVESAGTDNVIYRLGGDLAVRLPRVASAAAKVGKEHRWLPQLARRLPLDVPLPLALGEPTDRYAFPWLVCRWLPGGTATDYPLHDSPDAATALAGFVHALQSVEPSEGPRAGPGQRGGSLAPCDRFYRRQLAQLQGEFDLAALVQDWDAALAAPGWSREPVWVHGDLLPGNVLVHEGRLSAVIDFGGLAVGDPACELVPAWALFSGPAREAYRASFDLDEATWARGRGWALYFAVSGLPYYRESNPVFAGVCQRTLEALLADRA